MDKLTNIKIGKTYTILGFEKSMMFKFKRRLLDLGFTKGERIVFYRKSLLGKTYLVGIRGYILSLRDTIVKDLIIN